MTDFAPGTSAETCPNPSRADVPARACGRPRLVLGLLAALLLMPLFGAISPASAQIYRSFTPRFSTNDNGDIVMIGNTLMTCSGGGACTAGRNGTGGSVDNNQFSMVYVDIDGDGSTFNSSSANLTLPAGAFVQWAGLYWGGNSGSGSRNTVRFRTPVAAYSTVTATQLDANGTVYQGIADVTTLVRAGGNGTYFTANVQATTGGNRFAGWALVVVYRLGSLPPRNLVVFDGYAEVVPGGSVTIPVSGFLTPPAGAVNTRVGVVTHEGDLGYTGDGIALGGTTLVNAVNPATNFFNSTISTFGAHVTTKNPDYINQFGFDIDLIDASGVLPNSSTSTTIALSTNGDRYFPGAVSFATDLYQPVFSGSNFAKNVTDLNGPPVQPGDVLEYTIAMRNAGNDGAVQVVVQDTIPANSSYVTGSLRILSGPNAGAKTDGAGDDQANYDAGTNRVLFRLGTGANAIQGGSLAPGEATSARFQVRVNSPIAGGSLVSNQALVAFNAAQLGTPLNERSDGDTLTAGTQRTNATVTSVAIGGYAYLDANHNAQFDAGEVGTGATLYVKLVPASSPTSAVAATPVDPPTGSYAFTGVAPGTYTIILDTNASLSDVTPGYPGGHFGTEAATGSRSGVVLASTPVSGQNFGLWFGSMASGRVFRDDGAGGGTANDGAVQGTESGVSLVRMRVQHPACPGGVCDSTLTDGAGAFTLWIAGALGGTSVTIAEQNLSGWLSTGGRVGTTSGVYTRAADATAFTPLNGSVYTGLLFGDVPLNGFVANSTINGQAGGVVLHPHVLTARSAGLVTFSRVQTPSPAIPGWSADLYRDLNCNGAIDGADAPLAAAVPVVTGQTVCMIVRHQIPSGAPAGANEQLRVSARMDYANATPALTATVSLDDLTVVATGGTLAMTKSVSLASARPGDVLTYTIGYMNTGPTPVSAIVIQDATPAYTVYVSGACGTLGTGLTSCAITAQPPAGGTGNVSWTLGGVLAPGGSGSVSFQVRVQ